MWEGNQMSVMTAAMPSDPQDDGRIAGVSEVELSVMTAAAERLLAGLAAAGDIGDGVGDVDGGLTFRGLNGVDAVVADGLAALADPAGATGAGKVSARCDEYRQPLAMHMMAMPHQAQA